MMTSEITTMMYIIMNSKKKILFHRLMLNATVLGDQKNTALQDDHLDGLHNEVANVSDDHEYHADDNVAK